MCGAFWLRGEPCLPGADRGLRPDGHRHEWPQAEPRAGEHRGERTDVPAPSETCANHPRRPCRHDAEPAGRAGADAHHRGNS
jgi:hypothetical protein